MKRKEILDRMGLCLPQGKQIRVVISSDVSNEADDPFAIVHQLLTPIFDVRGVIAAHYEGKTHGDRQSMENSYRMLTALMEATGMTDVPMLRGCATPLAGEHDTPDAEGVRFLIEEAQRDDPRPLYVTVQGALTDVAAALNRCPAIAGKMTVVWIGGMPQGGLRLQHEAGPGSRTRCLWQRGNALAAPGQCLRHGGGDDGRNSPQNPPLRNSWALPVRHDGAV